MAKEADLKRPATDDEIDLLVARILMARQKEQRKVTKAPKRFTVWKERGKKEKPVN